LGSRNIVEKLRGLLRDRTGWLFGNSASPLPPPLHDPTLGQELRARLHQTQLQLHAKQSRQRVRRTTPRKNGASNNLQPSRTAHNNQINRGSRQRQIDDLYRAMWNRIIRDITQAVVKRETNSWADYFAALRELVSTAVTDSRGRGLSESEKADLTRRLLERINEFEKQW
jgi:hypothetical protein